MKAFKLENEPKIESGFKTPEHYFENFSAKVLQQLPKEEPKVISLFQKRKLVMMMAAAILVIALMIPIVNTYTTKTKELDSNTLENYLTYQSNMNQYDLISELDSEDINKINTPLALEDETIEDLLSVNSNAENLIIE
ncbi:hypothetical protein [Flavobacterium sp.]|uniref:hypothetical protein n=1 Tax=Flavobacterium sp. TaxID=239 RepID=UPI001B3D6544|nr:hypothetical protein [Flavobacterium sp.]MBP6180359.1 hypothetical protein [Flavobacterium sp.]